MIHTANDVFEMRLHDEIDNLSHDLAVAKKRVARLTEEMMNDETNSPCLPRNIAEAAQEAATISVKLEQAHSILKSFQAVQSFTA